jgi:hypothetical protein
MPDQRISCPRFHLLFKITAEGIAIKCRGCRAIHIVTWEELDRVREQAEKQSEQTGYKLASEAV